VKRHLLALLAAPTLLLSTAVMAEGEYVTMKGIVEQQ